MAHRGCRTITNPSPSRFSRRALLAAGLAAPLAVAAFGHARAADACVDEDALSDAELALRESLRFELKAADPGKACGKCHFYTAMADVPDCGTCTLLHGPVTSLSTCSSWAMKTASAAPFVTNA